MADQSHWFKLWESALWDDSIQALTPADRWRWAALGAYIRRHGTKGTAEIRDDNQALRAALGMRENDTLFACFNRLPHVSVSPPSIDNAARSVSFSNWSKYQVDPGGYERVKRARRAAKMRSKNKNKNKKKNKILKTPHTPRWGVPWFVIEFWKWCMEHPRGIHTPDKIRKIEARMAEGYDMDRMLLAIWGCSGSRHNRGENDRGRKFDSIDLILRDGGHLEEFEAMVKPEEIHEAKARFTTETGIEFPAPTSTDPKQGILPSGVR